MRTRGRMAVCGCNLTNICLPHRCLRLQTTSPRKSVRDRGRTKEIWVKVMRRLALPGPSVPGPRPGSGSVLAGDLAAVHRRCLAAEPRPCQVSEPSRTSWHLLRCARPASHSVSPGREPNLVPFSILEPLLWIKNQSNDGKESERTAAPYPPSCQGLNEPSGSCRVMRARLPAGMVHGPGVVRVGQDCTLLGAGGGDVSTQGWLAPMACETRGKPIGQVSDQTLQTVARDIGRPRLSLISWLMHLALFKKRPEDTVHKTTSHVLLREHCYIFFRSFMSIFTCKNHLHVNTLKSRKTLRYVSQTLNFTTAFS